MDKKRFEMRIYFKNKITQNLMYLYTHPFYLYFDDKRDAIRELRELMDSTIKRVVLFDNIKKNQIELFILKENMAYGCL